MAFKKATKKQAKLRLALHGPSGSGKTYTALAIAKHLGERIAVIDTERGSASKYADKFDFDVDEVTSNYNPEGLITRIGEAADAGYDVIIIDSMTHFWNGEGGFLESVDEEVKRMQAKGYKGDSFAAWKKLTPLYNKIVAAILNCKAHVIVTMRAKMEYEKVQNDRGKTEIRKIGLAPEMRDGFTYENDIEGMLNTDHDLVIGKTRCDAVDGRVFHKPGKELADILKAWLESGVPAVEAPASTPPAPAAPVRDFAAEIANAETLDDLENIGRAIKGSVSADERAALASAYTARKRELQTAQDNAEAAQ